MVFFRSANGAIQMTVTEKNCSHKNAVKINFSTVDICRVEFLCVICCRDNNCSGKKETVSSLFEFLCEFLFKNIGILCVIHKGRCNFPLVCSLKIRTTKGKEKKYTKKSFQKGDAHKNNSNFEFIGFYFGEL